MPPGLCRGSAFSIAAVTEDVEAGVSSEYIYWTCLTTAREKEEGE
jgi:hypothetical protein